VATGGEDHRTWSCAWWTSAARPGLGGGLPAPSSRLNPPWGCSLLREAGGSLSRSQGMDEPAFHYSVYQG
jgi:hypothetical protein